MPTNNVYEYGFAKDVKLAWRLKAGDRPQAKEFSDPISEADDGEDVVATWGDHSATIHGTNYGELRAAIRKSAADVIWEKFHVQTKSRLHLIQKPDRRLILALMEQNKQRLQVYVDKFGPLPGPQPSSVPRGTPALEKAIELLTSIGDL